MTILASVVVAAALHLDSDDVDGTVVVRATRLPIDFESAHLWPTAAHVDIGS